MNERRISIYFKDYGYFDKLRRDIVSLWFERYKESLTYSSAIIKSMMFLKSELMRIEQENKDMPNPMSKYARIGNATKR